MPKLLKLEVLILGLLILLAMPLTGHGQQIYKCESAGVLEFSDEACGEDAEKLTVEDLQANISIVEFIKGNYQPRAQNASNQSNAIPESPPTYPSRFVNAPQENVFYNDNGDYAPQSAYYPAYRFVHYPSYFRKRRPGNRHPRPAEPEPNRSIRKDLRPRNSENRPRSARIADFNRETDSNSRNSNSAASPKPSRKLQRMEPQY